MRLPPAERPAAGSSIPIFLKRGPQLLGQDTLGCGQKHTARRGPGVVDKVTNTNHRNIAPHTNHHGARMIVIWLLCVSLVLGGVAGVLASAGAWDRLRLRLARVPARVRRAVGRRKRDQCGSLVERGGLMPSPRVTTRPGPVPRPPA
jgi:hypothetical protein